MRTFLILLSIIGFIIVCCSAAGTYEGGTVTLECYCDVPIAYRSSPVYWYSYTFSTYLAEDYQVTIKQNLTSNLLNRLSVVGENGNFNMRLTNITYEDGGQYDCGYYDNDGRYVTVSSEVIAIQDPIPPNAEYPLCATEPSDQLYPGMEMRLVCLSRGGSPPAKLTWYREGIPLETTSTDFEGYHERTLTADDNGVTFVCKSTVFGVDTVKECSLMPLRLVPHVKIYSRPDPATIGENVEFTCVGEGEPAIATYFWYWNGELITTEDDRLIITGDSGDILILNSVQRKDNKALILCVVVTYTDLRNTDHVRLRVDDNSNLPTTDGKQHLSNLPHTGTVTSHDRNLSIGAVFGCIFVGILISVLMFGLLKATSTYKNRHHGNMDFTISMNHLNNFRHKQTMNEEELTELNQTHNKTCNLGIIDVVANAAGASGGVDTDYDHIAPDNDRRKASYRSDHKQIDESYANADLKTNSQIDNQTYFTVDSKDLCARNLDPNSDDIIAAEKCSEYEFPHVINPTKKPRVRSKSEVTQAKSSGYYQRPRRKMRKIREDSNSSLQRRNLAHSLPDLTPSSCFVTMPINIDYNHHDYVNMDVISPTSRVPDYHDYVNYTAHDNAEMRIPVARSDSSSSGYGEEPDSPRLKSATPTKKISYAELDFTEQDTKNGSTENILQTCSIPSAANAEVCEQTSYSQVAYVFKDRRQQSEPSVQRILGVTLR